jgi:hypothetical protein
VDERVRRGDALDSLFQSAEQLVEAGEYLIALALDIDHGPRNAENSERTGRSDHTRDRGAAQGSYDLVERLTRLIRQPASLFVGAAEALGGPVDRFLSCHEPAHFRSGR